MAKTAATRPWAIVFRIATAASAAWLEALSTGSRPKTAMTPVGPDSSMRPPKARTLSATSSRPRGPSPGDAARSLTRRKASRRLSHCAEAQGAGIASGMGEAPTGRSRSRCRRPYLSMRARKVLREIPRAAAVRRMLPPLARRTASMRVRTASSRDRSPAISAAGPSIPSGTRKSSMTSVISSPSESKATRSMALASSRTLPGQRWAARAARASGVSVRGDRP